METPHELERKSWERWRLAGELPFSAANRPARRQHTGLGFVGKHTNLISRMFGN